MGDAPILQDSTFRQLTDFIYEKCGIYIPPTKKYLVENRLSKLIEDYNLKGFEELLYLVKYSPGGVEQRRLFDAITTNETFFFREPQPLNVFIEKIVPKIIESKRTAMDINIWSAACSTGDEPFTISMLMREKRANVRTSIVASDLSTGVIKSARQGVFSSYSVRNVPESYMKKYFKKNGQNFVLDGSITGSVMFKVLNLVDKTHMAGMKGFDVIFCRNVLIYFNERSKQKAVSFLYDSLRPGGYLFIGSSESLHNVTRAFKPTILDRVVVYQKV